MKEKIINEILFDAMSKLNLTSEQTTTLKNVLYMKLYDVDIVKAETGIAVDHTHDNENYLKRFAMELKISGKSDNTIKQYVRQTQLLLDFTGKNFREITKDDVQTYIAHIISNGASGTTADNSRKMCNAFFNWALENEYIIKSPFFSVKPIKRNPQSKIVLTDLELTKMRDNCINVRELAIFDFLASTGLRVGEISNLKIQDVNFSNGTVRVFAHKTNEYRTVFLEPSALKHLEDYRMELMRSGVQTDWLFLTERGYKHMQPNRFEHVLATISQRAGIQKKVTVHTMRKTLATRLLRKGMKETHITTILGHNSFDTTLKFYASINTEDVQNEFLRCLA